MVNLSIVKTLIIPDVHLKINKLDRILALEGNQADQIVFLGDFFDAYNDTVWRNMAMAHKLNDLAQNDKIIFLYGNHDLHYLWENDFVRCSGFSWDKYRAIKPTVEAKTVQKFKWFHVLGDNDILLTHAGLHPNHWNTRIQGEKPKDKHEIVEWLTHHCDLATQSLIGNGDNWVFRAGLSRGGRQKYGGIVWNDADDFNPSPKIGQIFGHTIQREHPKWYDDNNICLDTDLDFYATYDDKTSRIEVHHAWFGDACHENLNW
jgi:predicted phosphodiesterase